MIFSARANKRTIEANKEAKNYRRMYLAKRYSEGNLTKEEFEEAQYKGIVSKDEHW